MSKRIIIITGVSASGKTTLQDELLNRGWARPINFSTRRPRNNNVYNVDEDGDYINEELSEYVFLDKQTFGKKLMNGDFIESTQYGGNFYGVSRHSFLEGNNNLCVILDPVGRAQVMEALNRLGIEYETYYIYIDEQLQIDRLKKRGDTEEEISKRKRDFNWFHPTNKCKRLNGKLEANILADIIEKEQCEYS